MAFLLYIGIELQKPTFHWHTKHNWADINWLLLWNNHYTRSQVSYLFFFHGKWDFVGYGTWARHGLREPHSRNFVGLAMSNYYLLIIGVTSIIVLGFCFLFYQLVAFFLGAGWRRGEWRVLGWPRCRCLGRWVVSWAAELGCAEIIIGRVTTWFALLSLISESYLKGFYWIFLLEGWVLLFSPRALSCELAAEFGQRWNDYWGQSRLDLPLFIGFWK